jgi:hypothetical protein
LPSKVANSKRWKQGTAADGGGEKALGMVCGSGERMEWETVNVVTAAGAVEVRWWCVLVRIWWWVVVEGGHRPLS